MVVMKEDRMDVEPCYHLFSAELESAEALASSQQKFQTLNLADYKVMRQLLPMTLVCHPTCLRSMASNPERTSDIICELEFYVICISINNISLLREAKLALV